MILPAFFESKWGAAIRRQRWLPFIPILLLFALSSVLLFRGELTIFLLSISYCVILIQCRISLRKFIHGFPGSSIVIFSLRCLFFTTPLLFSQFPNSNILSWGIPLGIIAGGLLQLCQFRTVKLALSAEFLAILPPLSFEEKLKGTLTPLLSGVFQEYYYRGAMLYILMKPLGLWAIPIVSFCFLFEHVMHLGALKTFDKYDFFLQVLLSMILGLIFYFTHSLAGCIIGHCTYNSVASVHVIRRKTRNVEGVEGGEREEAETRSRS